MIVPPSIHETGRPYQWVEPQRPVVDAPTWLLELLTGTTEKPRISPAEPTFNLIPEGRRNDTLTRLAGYLRRMGQSQAEIETALLDANTRRCIPPLPETEVRNIAASVARYPSAARTRWNPRGRLAVPSKRRKGITGSSNWREGYSKPAKASLSSFRLRKSPDYFTSTSRPFSNGVSGQWPAGCWNR